MSQTYFQFHQQLLTALNQIVTVALEPPSSEEDQQLLENLKELAEASTLNDHFYSVGQQTLCRIVAAYPLLVPQVPRDLFWLFGGDCLHFMPDDEIEKFQKLDELRFNAEDNNTEYDHEKERARILGLH